MVEKEELTAGWLSSSNGGVGRRYPRHDVFGIELGTVQLSVLLMPSFDVISCFVDLFIF